MKNKIIKLLVLSTIAVAMIPIIYLGTNKKEKVAADDNIQVAFFDAEAYMQTDEFKNEMNEELRKAYGDDYKEILVKNNLASEKAQKIEEMFTIHTTGEKIYPDYYGGMYIDDNDELVLQIVKQNIPLKQNNILYEKYDRLVSEKEYDKIEYVENSYNNLQQIINYINDTIIENNLFEVVSTYYLDIINNCIKIVSSDKKFNYDDLFDNNSFYNMVVFELGNKKTPTIETYKTGKKLNSEDGGLCTLGFRAKLNNKEGFVTAAHCTKKNIGYSFNDAGTIRKKVLYNNGTVDNMFVETNYNIALTNSLEKSIGGVTSVSTSEYGVNYTVGKKVGKLGAVSLVTLGSIVSNNVNITIELNMDYTGNKNYLIKDAVATTMIGEVGDSGGPVISLDTPGAFLGTVEAIDDNKKISFIKYSNIKNELGIVRY